MTEFRVELSEEETATNVALLLSSHPDFNPGAYSECGDERMHTLEPFIRKCDAILIKYLPRIEGDLSLSRAVRRILKDVLNLELEHDDLVDAIRGLARRGVSVYAHHGLLN